MLAARCCWGRGPKMRPCHACVIWNVGTVLYRKNFHLPRHFKYYLCSEGLKQRNKRTIIKGKSEVFRYPNKLCSNEMFELGDQCLRPAWALLQDTVGWGAVWPWQTKWTSYDLDVSRSADSYQRVWMDIQDECVKTLQGVEQEKKADHSLLCVEL